MPLASAIAFVLATVLGAMQCHALIRAALVISDAGYQNAHVLTNPISDAGDVAELRMVIAADREATAPLSAAQERGAEAEGQLQGMRSVPRDGGGAGGQLHHGLAGQ